jgi:hypothetical protein
VREGKNNVLLPLSTCGRGKKTMYYFRCPLVGEGKKQCIAPLAHLWEREKKQCIAPLAHLWERGGGEGVVFGYLRISYESFKKGIPPYRPFIEVMAYP